MNDRHCETLYNVHSYCSVFHSLIGSINIANSNASILFALLQYYRLQYRRDAEAAYQRKLLDACMGKAEFPKVRTFNNADASTNSVFHDLQTAATGDMLVS